MKKILFCIIIIMLLSSSLLPAYSMTQVTAGNPIVIPETHDTSLSNGEHNRDNNDEQKTPELSKEKEETNPKQDGGRGEWPPEYPTTKVYAYTWEGNQDEYDAAGYENLIAWSWINHVWDKSINHIDWHIVRATKMPEGHKVFFTTTLDRKMFRYYTKDEGTFDEIYGFDDVCLDSQGQPILIPDQPEAPGYPSIWWTNGQEWARSKLGTFLDEYKAAGGHIDTFVLDMEEYHFWKTYYLKIGGREEGYCDCQEWTDALQQDPRWTQTDAYGYNPSEIMDGIDLSYLICDDPKGVYYDELRARWDWIIIHERMGQYMNDAFYNTLKQRFPEVTLSNWGYHYFDSETPIPHDMKVVPYGITPGIHVGTHQTTIGLYGWIKDDVDITAFNAVLNNNNYARSAVFANPDIPYVAWIDFYTFQWEKPKETVQLWLTDHLDVYKENLFHTGLAGAEQFYLWNPRNPEYGGSSMDTDGVVNEALIELQDMIGYDTKKRSLVPELEMLDYENRFIYTGMQVGDYTIWRFTPELKETETINDYLLKEENDVVVLARNNMNTTTLTFPDAFVYRPEGMCSSLGLWIIQNKNAIKPYFGTTPQQPTAENTDEQNSTQPPGEPGQDPPLIADAGGPYSSIVNQTITLDGSQSIPPQNITNFTWDLGDGVVKTGDIVCHRYTQIGNYTIILTIKDDQGRTANDTTYVQIICEQEEETTHAIHQKNLQGTLIDTDNNGIFDHFYNDATGYTTTLMRTNDGSSYLIDENGDGSWDYLFNTAEGILTPYLKKQQEQPISIPLFFIIISLMILITAGIIIVILKNR